MKNKILLALLFISCILSSKAQTQIDTSPIWYYNESVGIGTTIPQSSKLHIYKNATTGGWGSITSSNAGLRIQDNGASMYIDGNTIYSDQNMNFGSFGNRYITFGTNDTERLRISETGNVGVGTTTPGEILHIKGNLYIEGTESYESGWKKNFLFWRGHSLIMGSKPGVYTHNRIELKPGGASQGKLISLLQLYDANNINDQTLKINITSSGATYFNGGNVGIGTNNPSHALDVNGTIHTKEVKVDMNGWSDFVFEKDYNLRPLQEVNTYIQQYGHLPEIPTAKEVEENGVSLGEMNAKLLQKIEELTLYTIEQEQRLKKLEKQNSEIVILKEKLKKIED